MRKKDCVKKPNFSYFYHKKKNIIFLKTNCTSVDKKVSALNGCFSFIHISETEPYMSVNETKGENSLKSNLH